MTRKRKTESRKELKDRNLRGLNKAQVLTVKKSGSLKAVQGGQNPSRYLINSAKYLDTSELGPGTISIKY